MSHLNAVLNPDAAAPVAGSVRRFFMLTFAITWCLQLPAVLAQRGLLPGGADSYMPLAVLGVLGPAVAATWLTRQAEGRAGVRRLLGGLLAFRAGLAWYLVALLLPGLLLSLGLYGLRLVGYAGPVAYLPAAGGVIAALIVSVGEEVGWRGYALPRLQRQTGPVAASGVLGVLWMLWHVPMFLGQGISLSLLPLMLLFFFGGSLTFTWLYNRGGGSLSLAVLTHVGVHLNNSNRALPGLLVPLIVHAIVYAAIGLAAVALDRRAFPRGFQR